MVERTTEDGYGGGTVEWIVFEGLIRRGVINVLWAPKGYAKSTLAGHLGSIVTGSASFPDRDTIPEALPILIYATEENRTIWEQRLRLMGGDPKLMAIPPDERRLWLPWRTRTRHRSSSLIRYKTISAILRTIPLRGERR